MAEASHGRRSTKSSAPKDRVEFQPRTAARLSCAASAALLLTLTAYAVYASSTTITCADMWWHLATGRYIVDHLEIPRTDIFSYTAAGSTWHNQEWLAQVIFYALFSSFGPTGLALFAVLLCSGMFLFAAWIAWRRSGSMNAAVAATVAASFVCRPYLDVRPQLFAFAGALVLFAVVDAYRRGNRVPIRLLVPIVMVLWVNLHSSFIYGIGLLTLYSVAELLKSRFGLPASAMPAERSRRFATAAVLGIVACLLNPQGVDAFLFPFKILGSDHDVWRTEVIEWMPTVLFQNLPFNPASFGYLLVAQVALAAMVLLSAARRMDVADAALVAVTVLMALRARRFVPLLALISVPFMAANLAVVGEKVWSATRDRGGVIFAPVASIVVCAGLLANVGPSMIARSGDIGRVGLFGMMTDTSYFPWFAAEFLKANPLSARLYSLYTWGGFVLFQAPGWKVFIDGRAHYVYPQEVYREQWIGEGGKAGWKDMLDREQINLILWPSESFAYGGKKVLARELRRSGEWVVVYEDNQAAVFAHATRGREWVDRYRTFGLEYPENPRAQLFLANAYLSANRFDDARDHLQDVRRRYPDTSKMTDLAERELLKAAQSREDPVAWFGVGFYREVGGDTAGAVEADRRAVALGLAAPHVTYAERALARLGESG